MLFVVFEDRTGMYITVDGDREVQNALGKALLGQKFYRCGGPGRIDLQSASVEPPPTSAARTSSSEPIVNPWDLLDDARFKKAYYAALGSRANEPWLAKLDGPAPETKKIRVDGLEYVMAVSCKNRDCEDNNLVLLYSPSQGKVYGKVLDHRRAFLIGEPPAAVATELDRLWTAEWRQKR